MDARRIVVPEARCGKDARVGIHRAYAVTLGGLALVFGLRVLGQALVAVDQASVLPPMEEWYSGLIPMTEPDVTLTDYVLFVECAAFAWLIARRRASREALRRWIIAFFVFTAVAALSGGTVHGFFIADGGGMGRVLWKLSMLAIGATALAGCAIGARLLFARDGADRAVSIAGVLTGVYAATILFVSDAFWIAVIGYLPAAALLFVAFLTAAVRERTSWARLGAWGLVVSFMGAAVQPLRVGLHPAYFNHNALYHLVQAVALALVFVACRNLLAPAGGFHADAA